MSGSELITWPLCRANLERQIERRRIDSHKKDHVPGPYLTVTFPDLFTDASLNYVRSYLSPDQPHAVLVSISHRCSPVYDWGSSATFDIGMWRL
jgi:hypothetical protein